MTDSTAAPGGGSNNAGRTRGTAQTTGRYVVVFADNSDPAPMLRDMAGMSSVASSRDFTGQAVDMDATAGADATVFAELGMAVVSGDPTQMGTLTSAAAERGTSVLAVVPELIHHVLPAPGYVEGYRDGVDDLANRLGIEEGGGGTDGVLFEDTDEFTWGMQAIGIELAGFTGQGIKVAVLDTGMDLEHPDFAGRSITHQSFVTGESAQDGHGHGTHVIGSSLGNVSDQGRRYGVASEADIFVGKVLSDQGSGSDAGILAGINWAVTNGCAVISMSLGADVAEAHPPYTVAGERALAAGTLIIAAAGNNADRPGNPGFVGAPANSPSILAVAALDSGLQVARFSARSTPDRGGQVDVAGPGVAVFSSWPMPDRYNTISGTSMATPHAAGVAALWAEATGRRGLELWATLAMETQRLDLPSVDVGLGMVRVAP
ncbi:MAG: S8 family serine peptidase [Ornithinimicrobium sp.]